MRYIHLTFATAVIISILACGTNQTTHQEPDQYSQVYPIATQGEKQRGGHVFGRMDTTNIHVMDTYNLDWLTFVPWGSQEDYDSQEIIRSRRNRDSTHLKQYLESRTDQIRMARERGYKVFYKPHIWMHEPSEGKWRSDIYPTSAENWDLWKESYRKYILQWARVAEDGGAEMFCVGTELTRLTLEKSAYWETLIEEIRAIYSGKLTYAANWYEEYENITFWDQLDYIGVQSYFPLTDHDSPSLDDIKSGWQPHLERLTAISQQYNKPILFTELGYKSTIDSARRPWEWLDYQDDMGIPIAEETQADCYRAFFSEVWPQPWFSGVHLWQFRWDFEKGRGKSDWDFTPQGKLAAEVIKEGFGVE